jgi:hypothetical protein
MFYDVSSSSARVVSGTAVSGMERWCGVELTGKTEELGGNLVPISICLPQIPTYWQGIVPVPVVFVLHSVSLCCRRPDSCTVRVEGQETRGRVLWSPDIARRYGTLGQRHGRSET